MKKKNTEVNWSFWSNAIGLFVYIALAVALVVLKALHILHMSWFWTLLPILTPFTLAFILILVMLLVIIYVKE